MATSLHRTVARCAIVQSLYAISRASSLRRVSTGPLVQPLCCAQECKAAFDRPVCDAPEPFPSSMRHYRVCVP
jgi:hypothetical protein